jgi:hypothetical protein
MPKPVCPKCGLFFRPKHNGYTFEEGKPYPDGDKPVFYTEESGKVWTSYKLWRGDLWECRGCGVQIIIGALHPVAEHFEPDYYKLRESYGGNDIPFVHDC